MKSKNIVIITSNFPFGGASANLVRYFTLCLSRGGYKTEVLLPTGFSFGKKVDQPIARSGKIDNVTYRYLGFVHHPNSFAGKIIDNALGLYLPLISLPIKSIRKNFHTIVVYNPTFTSGLLYLFLKYTLRKELIFIFPEFYEKPFTKLVSAERLKWLNFYLGIKCVSKFADKFIVLSEFLKKYIENRLRSKKEILIMPNLTDPQIFNRAVKCFKTGYTTIGYSGTPVRKDGILDLIKSFALINHRYPNTHLLIIGDITNGKSVISSLQNFATQLNIPKGSITFTGLIPFSQVPELLLSCQILALTRPNGVFAQAGFPTKIGEYFACRKPVLVTKVGDMVSYFKDKKEVVFAEPSDIDSIVTGFEFLINHPDEADSISLNGYNWMNSFLNYNNQVDKISQFVGK
jgi:glycosyltransferase involved in cell wall biosynthesis